MDQLKIVWRGIDDYDFTYFLEKHLSEDEKEIIIFLCSRAQRVIDEKIYNRFKQLLSIRREGKGGNILLEEKLEKAKKAVKDDYITFMLSFLYCSGSEFDLLIVSIFIESDFWKNEYVLNLRKELREIIILHVKERHELDFEMQKIIDTDRKKYDELWENILELERKFKPKNIDMLKKIYNYIFFNKFKDYLSDVWLKVHDSFSKIYPGLYCSMNVFKDENQELYEDWFYSDIYEVWNHNGDEYDCGHNSFISFIMDSSVVCLNNDRHEDMLIGVGSGERYKYGRNDGNTHGYNISLEKRKRDIDRIMKQTCEEMIKSNDEIVHKHLGQDPGVDPKLMLDEKLIGAIFCLKNSKGDMCLIRNTCLSLWYLCNYKVIDIPKIKILIKIGILNLSEKIESLTEYEKQCFNSIKNFV